MASMISSSAVSRATVAQASLIAPFTGVKSSSSFPVTKKSSIPTNGSRVKCMKVWPPIGLKKYETLSYLPPLSEESLAKEVDYLLRMGWVPCLEFELEVSCTVSTTTRQGTMMEGTGQCGSYQCLGAQTHLRC
ncbi:Ribulose bisphosphate carboxylase small subunit, chloroplastic [Linum perenne]